jgi:hypothetical protein
MGMDGGVVNEGVRERGARKWTRVDLLDGVDARRRGGQPVSVY